MKTGTSSSPALRLSLLAFKRRLLREVSEFNICEALTELPDTL